MHILCDCDEYKITEKACGKNEDEMCRKDEICLNVKAQEPCNNPRSSFKVNGELGENVLTVIEGNLQNELKESVVIEINDSNQMIRDDKGQYSRYQYVVTKIENDKITASRVGRWKCKL